MKRWRSKWAQLGCYRSGNDQILHGLHVEKEGPGRKEYNKSWCCKDYKFIRSRERRKLFILIPKNYKLKKKVKVD